MKTLVIAKDGSLSIQEVNKPRYNEYQALVKTIACGMCGTDIKLIHRTFKGFPESVYPIMLGHEGVGEVVEVGGAVKNFKPGDKVVVPCCTPMIFPFGSKVAPSTPVGRIWRSSCARWA